MRGPPKNAPRVTVRWNPERGAHLIAEGPEISVVRWDDNGVEQAIINEHLRKQVIRKRSV